VDRAEKNAQIVIPKDKKGRSDTMADLWMVDLVHAHSITAANILNRIEGANGPLEELLRRGLFDKDGDEYGDTQLKRSYRFAGAVGAQLLDHMIGLDNRVSRDGDYALVSTDTGPLDRRTRGSLSGSRSTLPGC